MAPGFELDARLPRYFRLPTITSTIPPAMARPPRMGGKGIGVRLGVTDLHRADIHILLVLFEAEIRRRPGR